jgi:allantoicase
VDQLLNEENNWIEILSRSELQGDSANHFPIHNEQRFTHLRFRIYPDGGVARLRVFGTVVPDWNRLNAMGGDIDLAAVEHGGLVFSCSDMFFGHRHNLIMPGRALNMSDGWETKRRRGPGHDWVIIRLGAAGTIRHLEVDTSYFKGNFPESCSLEADSRDDAHIDDQNWREVLPRTKLQAHTRHHFRSELNDAGIVSHIRFNIFPDGGVSRLRVYGRVEG